MLFLLLSVAYCSFALTPKLIVEVEDDDRMITNILGISILVLESYLVWTKIRIFWFNYQKSRFTLFSILFTLYDIVLLSGMIFIIVVTTLEIELQEYLRIAALCTMMPMFVRMQQWY